MSLTYVTIAAFDRPDAARQARVSLEQEGIPTMLEDKHSDSKVIRMFETDVSHVQLKVPAELADQARGVLRAGRHTPGGE